MTQAEHAASINIPFSTYESRLYRGKMEYLETLPASVIAPSTAREWTDNISPSGDFLIFSDVETPYHDGPFMDRCIRLAHAWGIKNLILAGDFVHFENFSAWGKDFQPAPMKAEQSDELIEIVNMLPVERRAEALQRLEKVGIIGQPEGIGCEMAIVRQTVGDITKTFDAIYYLMGNHESRKLRKQDYAEDTGELLRFLGAGEKWKATPYYWIEVESGGQKWRIEHPKGASTNYARDLAVQYHCSVAMGHSHRWAKQRDPSGDYYALQIGHCVDERRLAYVMQRSAKRDAHCLGALILRGGYPWLLSPDSPFEVLERVD